MLLFVWSSECVPATSFMVIGRKPLVFVALDEKRGNKQQNKKTHLSVIALIITANYKFLMIKISFLF